MSVSQPYIEHQPSVTPSSPTQGLDPKVIWAMIDRRDVIITLLEDRSISEEIREALVAERARLSAIL